MSLVDVPKVEVRVGALRFEVPPADVRAIAAAPAPTQQRKPLKDWLSRKEAAIYLSSIGCRISPRTLANLAANNNAGKGPPFKRFRWKLVQYRREDLDAWAHRECVEVM